MLLTGLPSTWWLGINALIMTWDGAVIKTLSEQKSAYELYQDLFSRKQNSGINKDMFICVTRAILAHIPYEFTEEMQLDIIYRLIDHCVQKSGKIWLCLIPRFTGSLEFGTRKWKISCTDKEENEQQKSWIFESEPYVPAIEMFWLQDVGVIRSKC